MGASATGAFSFACGPAAFALGANSTTVGVGAGASASTAGVTSVGAAANGFTSPAGIYSVAIGAGIPNAVLGAQSRGDYSVAIGGGDGAGASAAVASGAQSIAVGSSSNASVAGATALGFGAQASAAGSVAIGNGSVANQAGTVSIGAAGSERRLVNVAAGIAATDAVTVGQLQNGTFAAGLASVTTSGNAAIGGTLSVTGTTTTRGINNSGQLITGVGAGSVAAGSTEAVNGGQLFTVVQQANTTAAQTATNSANIATTNQRVAAALGGGAGVDGAGLLTPPSYVVQGSTFNNVGGALGALDTQVTANTTSISQLQGQVGQAGANQTTLGNTTAAALGGGATYAPATGITGLSYTLNGSGQAFTNVVAGQQALASGAAGPLQYATPGTPSNALTLVGTGGPVTLSNVAVGSLSASSTDAVNGSQLFATNQQVASLQAGTSGLIRGNNTNGLPAPSATGADATAAGFGASAAGAGSVAVGSGANANQANTTAIGTGATTTRANQVAIGTGTQTYTLAGLASARSLAAQSGPTSFVTTDANGNLATSSFNPGSVAALDGRVTGLEAAVTGLGREIGHVRQEARRGIAAAMAMTTASMPSAPGRTTWATNAAVFRGEWAGGFSMAHRLDTAVPLALTGGYAYGGGNSHGARVGLQGEF